MKKEVKQFIKKYSVTENNLSYFLLEQIFTKLGYKIIRFNAVDNTDYVDTLIEAYDLYQNIKHHKSFIYTSNFVKLVFLHEYISEDELIHYMLHELGHIWCNHLSSATNEDLQEREADEFAVQVKLSLHQQHMVHKYSKIIFITVLALCVSIALIWCIYTQSNKSNSSLSPQVTFSSPSPIPTTIIDSDISTRQVIITSSGDKFHRADCQYVKNKTDTLSITIEEAINSGRTPCKVCRPTE